MLSTPRDQSEGVLESLRALARPNVERFVHGTTVATNMLLERKGADVVFCVTEGFTDLLYLRRQNRSSLYDLSADYPPPLASYQRTVDVPERSEPQIAVWQEYKAELRTAFENVNSQLMTPREAMDYVRQRLQPKLDRSNRRWEAAREGRLEEWKSDDAFRAN